MLRTLRLPLEENSLVTKQRAPKLIPRTVDSEPPDLVREQWELERMAHDEAFGTQTAAFPGNI